MSVPESLAGQQEKCIRCGHTSSVPGAPAPAAPALQAPQSASPAPAVVVVQQQAAAVRRGKGTSALGVTALVLGILAILGCWIPIVNFISIFLAGLGILFAMIGFLVAVAGGKTGMGMPIAGGFVCVVAIVIAVVVLGMLGHAFGGAVGTARTTATHAALSMVAVAVDTFELDLARCPTTDEGLEVLFAKPSDPDVARNWRGPYIRNRSALADGWGNELRYEGPTSGDSAGPPYRLWSLGPDGVDDTGDEIIHTSMSGSSFR